MYNFVACSAAVAGSRASCPMGGVTEGNRSHVLKEMRAFSPMVPPRLSNRCTRVTVEVVLSSG